MIFRVINENMARFILRK